LKPGFAIFCSALGLVAATAYGIYLALVHQSSVSDQEIMIWFALLVGLVVGSFFLSVSWVSFALMFRVKSSGQKLFLLLISLTFPVSFLCSWSVTQWGDWDEFAIAWIALIPTLLAAGITYQRSTKLADTAR
jgi:hypothetical protein